MSKVLTVRVELENAAFEDNPEEAARILREMAGDVEQGYGAARIYRDINGNTCGAWKIAEEVKPRRMRAHTLLLWAEYVTLWPVEKLGPETLPPDDVTEPLVWFNHAEGDWSEPLSIMEGCFVNRWGWAYASEDISEAIKAEGGYIDLKRQDREALRDCGSANADMLRKS